MKQFISKILAQANVVIDGPEEWDIQIHNPNFYSKVLAQGVFGLGEAYIDGWWDCRNLELFLERVLTAKLDMCLRTPSNLWAVVKAHLFNMQNKTSALKTNCHYNLGNDFYRALLGPTMFYTCGYWRDATTLEDAQLAKAQLICEKLKLSPGMSVLEFGCGWGEFAKYITDKHNVYYTGCSLSAAQISEARTRCGNQATFRQQDYIDIIGRFDRMVSMGFLEHIGRKHYRDHLKSIYDMLTDDGLAVIHAIARNDSNASGANNDKWIRKYIFPCGELPSLTQIAQASEDLLVIEDVQNIGPDYYNTLIAWYNNLQQIPDVKFKRMWDYYLLGCAVHFKLRNMQLYQIVFSKKHEQRYDSPR